MSFDGFNRLSHGLAEDYERKLVEFRIGDLRCGVDIMRVREILNEQDTVPVPAAPRFIVGAADHRESMVPVVDLCVRLGLDHAKKRRPKWVIVTAFGAEVALLVDIVAGVPTVAPDNERERHPLVDGADDRWVKAVYSVAGELMFELDLDAVAGAGADLPKQLDLSQERK